MGALNADITSHRLLVLKGGLFVIAGVLSSVGLLLNMFTGRLWAAVALHVLAVWCFCRAYYFAFYVIEKYIDPTFRYAGVMAAVRRAWAISRR